jgi:hypothetical protein
MDREQLYRGYLKKMLKTYFKVASSKIDIRKPYDANQYVVRLKSIPFDNDFKQWILRQGPALALFGLKIIDDDSTIYIIPMKHDLGDDTDTITLEHKGWVIDKNSE